VFGTDTEEELLAEGEPRPCQLGHSQAPLVKLLCFSSLRHVPVGHSNHLPPFFFVLFSLYIIFFSSVAATVAAWPTRFWGVFIFLPKTSCSTTLTSNPTSSVLYDTESASKLMRYDDKFVWCPCPLHRAFQGARGLTSHRHETELRARRSLFFLARRPHPTLSAFVESQSPN
jgi:hypothetical protein